MRQTPNSQDLLLEGNDNLLDFGQRLAAMNPGTLSLNPNDLALSRPRSRSCHDRAFKCCLVVDTYI